MGYDHGEKIGNQGDVAKHAILASVVSELSNAMSETEIFDYVESHTGYAEYTLPPRKGRWERGIRVLADKCGADWPTCLHSYRDWAFPQWRERSSENAQVDIVSAFDRYPGSSVLVFRAIRRRCDFNFTLHEVNASAVGDLSLYYPFWDKVQIRREDGYAGILARTSASFVLVDPPNLDLTRLLEVMSHLKKRQVPFMVWTPRIGNSSKPTSEASDYIEFRERARQELGLAPLLFRWHENWRSETCGCCIHLFPDRVFCIGTGITTVLREKMNWWEE